MIPRQHCIGFQFADKNLFNNFAYCRWFDNLFDFISHFPESWLNSPNTECNIIQCLSALIRYSFIIAMNFCFGFLFFILIQCQYSVNAFKQPIIFPDTVLQKTYQKSFDLLSSASNSNDSVLEICRAVEAFSLKYFQVRIDFCVAHDKNHIQMIHFFFHKSKFYFI